MTTQEIIQTFIDHEMLPKNINQNLLLSNTPRIKIDNVFKDTSFWIAGSNGIGKTHYTTLFLRDWLVANFLEGFKRSLWRQTPDFITMDSLENHIKNSFGFDADLKGNSKSRLKDLKITQLLIIDDFWLPEGTDKEKSDFKNIMFGIFSYRFENKLQTIISTNLDLENLGKVDPSYSRIASRILGLCEKVELENKVDLRLKNSAQTSLAQTKKPSLL